MIKNIFLFIISIVIGGSFIIFAYLWSAPRYTQILKPFFPKTLFSLENAPADSLAGTVASLSGDVTLQTRLDKFSPLALSSTIPQGSGINVLENSNAVINFPQTVTVTASSAAKINFIQTLPVNFVLEQQVGTVTYAKEGITPVSIRALDLLINIEQGNCNVTVDKDSSSVKVDVVSGSVTAAFNDTDGNTIILTIPEGKSYLFNNNTKVGKIKSL